MKPRLLIIQPGRVGDILICLPIAEYYSKTYDVYWQCPKEYHDTFRNINYCKPVRGEGEWDLITVHPEQYNRIIDLSFGFGGKPEQWWQENKLSFKSFVDAKYELAGLPVAMARSLRWQRDLGMEEALCRRFTRGNYILIHRITHAGSPIEVKSNLPIIEFKPVDNFNIFDWYKVILNAKEIHCIDSSLCNFVDAINPQGKLFYYITDKVPYGWCRTILAANWKIINTI